MNKISESALTKIVDDYLAELSKYDYNFAILKKISFKEGLMVIYQSREFVETKSPREAVLGLSPFIIDYKDGSVFHRKDLCLDVDELISFFKREKGYTWYINEPAYNVLLSP